MKICHLVLNYFPSIGGTQILFKGISENLVNLYKDEVEVLTVDSYFGPHSKQYKRIELVEETINGVFVRRFSFYRKYRFFLSILHKLVIKIIGRRVTLFERYMIGPWSPSLKRAINNTSSDVICASSSTFLYMNYPLYRHKLKFPKPFVFQGAIHFSPYEHEHVVSDKTLKSIKASEYYISNTEYEKDRLIKLGVSEEMIVVVGTAVNMQEFENGSRNKFRDKYSLSNDDILVGYIGRIEATKSIDILLDAFEKVNYENKNIYLVLAGFQSNYAIQLQAYINNLDTCISKKIFLEFNISNSDKIDLYHAIDMLVLPSVNESFGIVFLEAWSCKKPVVGTSVGAVKSVISDGVDGLLMKPYDSDSLKNCIINLAINKELCSYLGNNGYSKTQTNYTWEIVTKKYRDVYLMAVEKFNKNFNFY